MSAVRIAAMQLDDVAAVLYIEGVSSPRPWTRGVFVNELADPLTRHYTVARDHNDEIVGFCGIQHMVDDAHVANIAVLPAERRHRVGARLLLNGVRTAISRGAVALTLEVRASNMAAQRLYHRFGLAPIGIRPRYYEGVEDAVIMWAHDITQPEYSDRLAKLEAELGL
jgi:[ribosomal protein S18]-alanine N-acetyltransferase